MEAAEDVGCRQACPPWPRACLGHGASLSLYNPFCQPRIRNSERRIYDQEARAPSDSRKNGRRSRLEVSRLVANDFFLARHPMCGWLRI